MNGMKTTCLGYSIFTGELEDLCLTEKCLVSTLNQYSYCVAENDSEFKMSLLKSDVLLPDGIAIVAASKFLEGKKIKKIAGADLHQFMLNELNQIGGSCFYLGSCDKTLHKIKERLAVEFPDISADIYSPPFKTEFTASDNALMLKMINAFNPDVLFVGMTAPKQEKWAYSHKKAIDARMICSIGAVFDFYAGTKKRPNKIWIGFGLEWLGRLIREPKRMWKRYIYYGFVFGYYLSKEKYKKLFV